MHYLSIYCTKSTNYARFSLLRFAQVGGVCGVATLDEIRVIN